MVKRDRKLALVAKIKRERANRRASDGVPGTCKHNAAKERSTNEGGTRPEPRGATPLDPIARQD